MSNQELSRLDLIRIIGDMITAIDVARGSLPKGSPERKELDSWRLRLDAKQHALADAVFDEGTVAYQSASADIDRIASAMSEAIMEATAAAYGEAGEVPIQPSDWSCHGSPDRVDHESVRSGRSEPTHHLQLALLR